MFEDENLDLSKREIQPLDTKLRDEIGDELNGFVNPQEKKTGSVSPIIPNEVPAFKSVPTDYSSAINKLDTTGTIKKPIIRTYKSDVEETIQSGHLSSVNIAISQNQRMMKNIQTPTVATDKKSWVNKSVLIASIILILSGMLAVFLPYYFVQKQNPNTPAPITIVSKNLITPNIEERINLKDINQNRVALTLKERVDQSAVDLGQIKNFLLVEGEATNETIVTAQDFLSLIKASVPLDLQRTLKPEYMFGMYSFNGSQEFLILKVGAFDVAFSGMFNWEADLWQNMKPLFGLTDTFSTSTPSGTEKKFQDAAFFNKDCRVIKDASGKIVFLYSIVDENTIVIASSPDTLKEIIARLTSAQSVTQ